ncbi:transmembrane prolyl 4-hydroxylase-like isoform X1 [Porites lutea]|uniref:transmembrane prolyl 4-hydroxylase-like isoform X1 n=1 Tax=Porites lutea TaxID=51062 RepID=UPI003CC63B72
MEHCLRTRKFPGFTVLFVVFFTLEATGKDQAEIVPSVCSAQNPDCFFQRFENFKLPRVEPVKVGHIQKINLTEGVEHEMVTAATQPPIFEIPNFLSDEECDHIIQLAKNEGLETSQTVKEGEKHDTMSLGKNTKEYFKVWDQNRDGQIDMDEMIHNMEILLDFSPDKPTLLKMYSALELDKDQDENISFEEFKQRNTPEMAKFIQKIKGEQPHTKSRHSRQTWIEKVNGSLDSVVASIQERVHRLTMLPLDIIKASEYLQVVSYGPMGHYNCHLDSDFIRKSPCCHYLGSELRNCRVCRYATILYFLDNVEDGGETAFPIADNSTFDDEVWMSDAENVCNLAKNCHKANVVVKPEKGKAILWYNHKVNNMTGWMGQLDKFSFHGGCDVKRGTKWIANNWISLSEDREKDILNWIELAQEEENSSKPASGSEGDSSEESLHQEL